MSHEVPRVLIVDDEVEGARALQRLLRRDFETEYCGSGEEGLETLERFQPDAVISDFTMPGMNGADFLAKVQERAPRCRRLLFSGNAGPEVASPGVVELFLDKPWNGPSLVSVVRQMVGHGEAAST